MIKKNQSRIIITLLVAGAVLLTMSIISTTTKYAYETACFAKTRDIRCYQENRWEKHK